MDTQSVGRSRPSLLIIAAANTTQGFGFYPYRGAKEEVRRTEALSCRSPAKEGVKLITFPWDQVVSDRMATCPFLGPHDFSWHHPLMLWPFSNIRLLSSKYFRFPNYQIHEDSTVVHNNSINKFTLVKKKRLGLGASLSHTESQRQACLHSPSTDVIALRLLLTG